MADLTAGIAFALLAGTIVSTYLLQRARVGERLAVSKAIEASGNLLLANKETERRKRQSAAACSPRSGSAITACTWPR